jgi:hypothetical protein
MRRTLFALLGLAIVLVIGSAVNRSSKQVAASKLAAIRREEARAVTQRDQEIQDSISRIANSPLSGPPEFQRQCDAMLRSAVGSGALIRFAGIGRNSAKAVVGGPWHGLTFEEKEMLATAIAYRCALTPSGRVTFRGLYTNRVQAEFENGTLSVF